MLFEFAIIHLVQMILFATSVKLSIYHRVVASQVVSKKQALNDFYLHHVLCEGLCENTKFINWEWMEVVVICTEWFQPWGLHVLERTRVACKCTTTCFCLWQRKTWISKPSKPIRGIVAFANASAHRRWWSECSIKPKSREIGQVAEVIYVEEHKAVSMLINKHGFSL
jgi:hypothetical protein